MIINKLRFLPEMIFISAGIVSPVLWIQQTTVLFSFSGEYPVPFIGFWLSPIAGYRLAVLQMDLMKNGRTFQTGDVNSESKEQQDDLLFCCDVCV